MKARRICHACFGSLLALLLHDTRNLAAFLLHQILVVIRGVIWVKATAHLWKDWTLLCLVHQHNVTLLVILVTELRVSIKLSDVNLRCKLLRTRDLREGTNVIFAVELWDNRGRTTRLASRAYPTTYRHMTFLVPILLEALTLKDLPGRGVSIVNICFDHFLELLR